MDINIVVSSHKPYWLPRDPLYLPVQVGKGEDWGGPWKRDNTGKNISGKNPTFCELTALYWAWKNTDTDALGLCHYRRYLGSPSRRGGEKHSRILSGQEAEELLHTADVLLPRKRHYWIETRESQYAHAHHREDLECVEGILKERFPEYLDAYCRWLFEILFEAERRLDISGYSAKDARVFGYLGERLLDVWIRKNGLTARELPVVSLESVNWVKKGTDFLKRKWARRG